MEIAQKRRRTLETSQPQNQALLHNNDDVRNGAGESDGIDRISNLPTDVICHILSFLPTKYAVGTSILSTSWKNLFPLIPNLKICLDDSLFMNPSRSASNESLICFKSFVERLLNVTLRSMPYVPSIDCLDVACRSCNDGQEIAKWVNAAKSLDIKKMDLYISQLQYPRFLINSLFGANITNLSLMVDFGNVGSEYRFSLPKLTVLYLRMMNSRAINALLEGCPSLKCLVLVHCLCGHGSVIRVHHPWLKVLKLYNGLNSLGGVLELDVPRLEYLCYEGFLPGRLKARRPELLETVHLDLKGRVSEHPYAYSGQADALVKACANAENFWVSERSVRMLNRYPRPLPRFPRMLCLEIPKMEPEGWQLLLDLLDSALKLTHLVLESGFDVESYMRFKNFMNKSVAVRLTQCGETRFDFEFSRKSEN